MKKLLYILLFTMCYSLIFSSCTVQKRRYSSGYHVTWHHSKNTLVSVTNDNDKRKMETKDAYPKRIAALYNPQQINTAQFSKRYPSPNLYLSEPSNPGKYNTLSMPAHTQFSYKPAKMDTQVTLTPTEIEEGYFVNASGKKKKYRQSLRNFLIKGGLIMMIFGLIFFPISILGTGMFIAGLILPKPNKRSLLVSHSLYIKSRKDKRASVATGIIAGALLIIITVGLFIALAMSFA